MIIILYAPVTISILVSKSKNMIETRNNSDQINHLSIPAYCFSLSRMEKNHSRRQLTPGALINISGSEFPGGNRANFANVTLNGARPDARLTGSTDRSSRVSLRQRSLRTRSGSSPSSAEHIVATRIRWRNSPRGSRPRMPWLVAAQKVTLPLSRSPQRVPLPRKLFHLRSVSLVGYRPDNCTTQFHR